MKLLFILSTLQLVAFNKTKELLKLIFEALFATDNVSLKIKIIKMIIIIIITIIIITIIIKLDVEQGGLTFARS